MSKRLQILMNDAEYLETQALAKRHHQTTAEWVRGVLREARQRAGRTDASEKLRAVQIAAGFNFPTCNVKQMLEEVERGYSDRSS